MITDISYNSLIDDKRYSKEAAATHLAQLRQTPIDLHTIADPLSEEILQARPEPEGEWSPLQILAHIDSCAEVWSYSIYAMLRFETPTIKKIPPA